MGGHEALKVAEQRKWRDFVTVWGVWKRTKSDEYAHTWRREGMIYCVPSRIVKVRHISAILDATYHIPCRSLDGVNGVADLVDDVLYVYVQDERVVLRR